jgi:23S rRNA pseudouridine1911/1915/1917 synthase
VISRSSPRAGASKSPSLPWIRATEPAESGEPWGGRYARWVVEQTGQRLGTWLESLGGPARNALAEGRVFVQGERATNPDQELGRGVWVGVSLPRPEPEPIRVLDEYGGMIAVDKPAGMPSEPDRSGRNSLVHALAAELHLAPTRLHVLGRLDVGVSGIVLVARHRAARLMALRARTEGQWVRRYLALSARAPTPSRGVWDQNLASPRTGPLRGRNDGRSALTVYRTLGEAQPMGKAARVGGEVVAPAFLLLEPRTGRTHQLRAHAAQAGLPLLGDRAYGGPVDLVTPTGAVLELRRIALHAVQVKLMQDGTALWEVQSPAPPELGAWWKKCGGEAAAWINGLESVR